MNTVFDPSLVSHITGYCEKAKKRTFTEKNTFQSIKENIETQNTIKTSELSNNNSKTLEEFKKEIYDIINSVPITGLAGSQITINISDKAFEKMMNDEQFMKIHLGALIRDLSCPPTPMYSPTYVVFEIDTENGYRGTSYGSNYKSTFENKSKDSFWEKRRKKFKETMKEQEEYYINKKLKMKCLEMKKINARSAAKQMALNRGKTLITSYECKLYMPSLFSDSDLFDDIIL